MSTRIVSKCSCGRRKSRYAQLCKACDKAKREARILENTRILESGCCPQCGAGFKRNLSLAGWWQCEQYGAQDRRKDPSKPACSFQMTVC